MCPGATNTLGCCTHYLQKSNTQCYNIAIVQNLNSVIKNILSETHFMYLCTSNTHFKKITKSDIQARLKKLLSVHIHKVRKFRFGICPEIMV